MRFMMFMYPEIEEKDWGPQEGNVEEFEAMSRYNEELRKAGMLLSLDGLQPPSEGGVVKMTDGEATITDGPFAEAKELVAGFWIWQVRSMEEAIEWAKRCPNPMNGESELEIRQVFEADDFGATFTPELREQEDRLRAQIESQQKQ